MHLQSASSLKPSARPFVYGESAPLYKLAPSRAFCILDASVWLRLNFSPQRGKTWSPPLLVPSTAVITDPDLIVTGRKEELVVLR